MPARIEVAELLGRKITETELLYFLPCRRVIFAGQKRCKSRGKISDQPRLDLAARYNYSVLEDDTLAQLY